MAEPQPLQLPFAVVGRRPSGVWVRGGGRWRGGGGVLFWGGEEGPIGNVPIIGDSGEYMSPLSATGGWSFWGMLLGSDAFLGGDLAGGGSFD